MKTLYFMKKVFTLVMVSLLLTGSLSAQSKPEKFEVPVSQIIQAEFYGETAPLKSYTPDPNATNEVVRGLKLGYSPKHDWPLHEAVNPNALPAGPDPAWQKDYTEANNNRAVNLTEDYAGMGFSGVNPPDPVVDVGPNHVIQMINGTSGALFQIWDKSGTSLVSQQFMDNFFNSASGIGGSGASGKGDPIVLYDQLADRWFMAEFSVGSNDIYILVSTTSDPTGTWYAYTFTAPNFPDYLKFAVWPDAYTMTSNESGPSPIYAFDRMAMLAGNPATFQRFTVPDNQTINFQAMTPVGVEGSTAPPVGNSAYFMRMTDDAWSASVPADRLEIYDLNVDFATPANSVFSGPTFLTTDPFDTELCGYTSFFCMNQPGTTTQLDPLREVLMYKVQYRNFGTHESIVCNHVTDVDNTDRGGIRWYELRRTGMGPWTIYQQGTYSPDADDRWMAAININADGQIGLLYNRSSSSTFPSIYCTGRNPGDPLGMMTEPETLVEAGAGSNPSNRYGDYSSLSVDPSDEKTFWGTAEYNPSVQWGTRIAAFEFEVPATPCEELFISEYIEGSGDNKCLEIYNPTDAAIGLSAGNYAIEISFNGGTSTTTINLTGIVASGDVYVVCDNGADAAFLAEADQTPNNSFWNGDDAITLIKDGTPIDYFGSVNEDPGTQWSVSGNMTQNRTLRRNSDVSNGLSSNPAVGFPELGTEWTEFPQDDVSGLGEHTSNDCAAPSTCSITNVMITDGPNCGTPPNQNTSFFDISFDVAGGSGVQYNLLNPATMISYSVIPSATTDGTVTGSGGASSGATPGTTAQLIVVDANNATCQSAPIDITVPICPPPVAAGEIIITEIMKNPNTISDANGEWFEVYNTTGDPIDLIGWEIADNDSDDHVIASSVVVPANGFAVLGRNGDSGVNGGLTYDYVYGNDIQFSNDTDELILTASDETEIDRVEYNDADFPDPNGASLNLSPVHFNAMANDLGENWCTAVTSYDMNNEGTPGVDNTACFGSDLCDGASLIECGQTIVGTNVGFSNNDAPSFCGTSLSSGAGVWFVFEGTGEFIEATTCGAATNFDTKIGVFEGPCGDLDCVAGDDDEPCEFAPLTSRVYFQSEDGVTYYIYVTGFLASSGTFELSVNCILPPENDDVCDAIPLTLGVQEVVSNVGASVQDGEPNPGEATTPCIGNDGWCPFDTEVQNSVWYTIDIPSDGCYEIYTLFRDLQLAVWEVGDCDDFGTFTEVYANDDFGPFGPDGPPFPFPDGDGPLTGGEQENRMGGGGFGGTSSPYINEYFTAGTYYIQVDGNESEFTTDDFILVQASAECVLPCEDKNLLLTLTLDAFPQETTWELRNEDGDLYGQGGPYFFFGDGPGANPIGGDEEPVSTITITEFLCSEEECYNFSIFDSFGDGICCDDGEGGYTFSIDGEIIYEGDGEYGDGETVEICIDPCIIAGYETDDVGTAPTEGEYTCEDDEVIITSSGQNGFDPLNDNFGFVYQEICGDGEIVAKIESIDGSGWAGIMMRETTDSDAKSFALFSDLSPNTQSQTRYTTGGLKVQQQHFFGALAIWLKIERQGNWFFAYKSADGINFNYVHAVNVAMDPCVLVGLATSSNNPGVPVTGTFSNIQISGGIAPGIDTPDDSILDYQVFRTGEVSLFPNPASSSITLEFSEVVDRPTNMVLRNNLGQLIEQRPLETPAVRTEWDVSQLRDGIYFIEIRTEGDRLKTLRFVKG